MTSTQERARRAGAITVWLAALAGIGLGVDALLTGPLAPPTLTDPGSWATWVAARQPVEAGFALVGGAVVVLAWYLFGVTSLALVARWVGAARLVSLADLVTLPAVRRSVQAVLGLGLAGVVTTAGTASAVGSPPGARAQVGDTTTTSVAVAPSPAEVLAEMVSGAGVAAPGEGAAPDGAAETVEPVPDQAPVMRLLPTEPDTAVPAAEPGAGELGGPEVAPAPGQWEVRPGDHLWSVAARVLEQAGGTAVSDDDVAPYWRALVEANRSTLADPLNPDLVFPGQLLVVPPTAG